MKDAVSDDGGERLVDLSVEELDMGSEALEGGATIASDDVAQGIGVGMAVVVVVVVVDGAMGTEVVVHVSLDFYSALLVIADKKWKYKGKLCSTSTYSNYSHNLNNFKIFLNFENFFIIS